MTVADLVGSDVTLVAAALVGLALTSIAIFRDLGAARILDVAKVT